ncbi:MAG: hypothetical protein SGBAC_001875 [Bacillariaceae sp.]
MSNIDYASCLSALTDEVHTYQNFVYLSLGVTLICSLIRSAKAEKFKENPSQGANVLFSFAVLKVILGIVLLVTFPGCPDVCQGACTSTAHHFIYPIIVFVVAFFWFHLGNRYRKLASAQAAVVAGEGARLMEARGANASKEIV